MKKIIFSLMVAFLLITNACTNKFEEANTNPYEISSKSLEQDFNHVGAYYPSMLGNIFGHQIEENLVAESFADYMATPTPFVGGVNNTTYYIRWNTYWDRIYGSLMAPANQVIKIADAGGYTVFSAWAKLIQIMGVSRLTTYHGPVIYSNYGSTESTIKYDSESELYTKFFAQLDEIQSVFAANKTYTGMKNSTPATAVMLPNGRSSLTHCVYVWPFVFRKRIQLWQKLRAKKLLLIQLV